MATVIADRKHGRADEFLRRLQSSTNRITVARVMVSWVGDDRTLTVIRPERGAVAAICQAQEVVVGMVYFPVKEIEVAYGRLFKPNKLVDRFSDQPGYFPNEQMHTTRDQRLGVRWDENGYGWCPPKGFLQLVISYGCTKLSQATVRHDYHATQPKRYIADLVHATEDAETGWSERICVDAMSLQAFASGDHSPSAPPR